MDTNDLLHKIANTDLRLPPALRDVVTRVKSQGLHKVAAPMLGVPGELTMNKVAFILGARLSQHRQKWSRIKSAMLALNALEQDGTLKSAAMFRMNEGQLENLIAKAPKAVEEGGFFSGARDAVRATESPGLFAGQAGEGSPGLNLKSTIRGSSFAMPGERLPINALPTQ